MKLQLVHLSDMHIANRLDCFEIQVNKMIQALNSVEDADECIIVISGDLAATGKCNEYKHVGSLIGAISKSLREEKFEGKYIHVICVPGNHDIFFQNTDTIRANALNMEEDVNVLVNRYLSDMKSFFSYAQYKKCFLDNKVVSKKVLTYGEKKVGFVMLNTAPLSVLGGNTEDMGYHYLSDDEIFNVEQATEGDINILVMHHSIEWFSISCKDKLRKIISKKYSLVLTGHEHESIGESRNIDRTGEVQYVQGNALRGYAVEGNGFCAINIDFGNSRMIGHSFLWNKSFYTSRKILDAKIKDCVGGNFTIKRDFLEMMEKDGDNRNIDDYYVFPSLTYTTYNVDDEVEKHEIDEESELIGVIEAYKKIVITGEHKSGKTTLAKRLFRKFLSCGKTPLLLTASDIYKKKVEKTIEYAFCEQYYNDSDEYELFKQIDKSKKVALLDEADLINKGAFDALISYLETGFGKTIVLSEDKMELDIRKQVVDIMVEEDTLNITIKPFLYIKRKKLISNILLCDKSTENDILKETNKINELINSQVRFFNLNPEFIINFVNQYEKNLQFQFSSGINVFNIVYENSIRNRIIENSENIDVATVFNVLRELAFYMHFEKRSYIGIDEIARVVDQYKCEYRQKVNTRLFVDTAIKAKILVDIDNKLKFKDHTIVAYFVAQALNLKYHQEENIKANLEYLLKNLCFSINSDIILFLALITNNPKIVNIIVESAKKHFENQEELSFDARNINFLLNATIPVKNSLPSEEEREQRDKLLEKQEEYVELSDLIELVDSYDYSESDLLKDENQIMISFKYIEILSKTLPAFCQNMKVDQQDNLVELIYKCPNQFLYRILININDNFDTFCDDIYKDISALRREKNIAEVNIDSVKYVIEQMSAILIMSLYQVVATTCTSEQTSEALSEFDFNKNSNYKLQNLMMRSRIAGVTAFSRRARELNKKLNNKIEKSIIKYTVREYLLRNDVEIYGEAQSLIDCFFGKTESQKMKMDIAKRRIIGNDRI